MWMSFGHPQLNRPSAGLPTSTPAELPSWGTELGASVDTTPVFQLLRPHLFSHPAYTLEESLWIYFQTILRIKPTLPTSYFLSLCSRLAPSFTRVTAITSSPCPCFDSDPFEFSSNRATMVAFYRCMTDHVTPVHKPPMVLCCP
ncbi:hypothetical protein HJG60_008656 [Phyllostomus discolor]|uniref:Uncharacterized protein n=1 Tax=Phyllostomus discolor TaxID=89673 RepID=A0A834DLM9_9CHIR|nr:hypothetical protein HJG60_008656 [Phyllostomus discolor]